jgi:phytoene dehydrogenase-like protein
MGLGNDGPAYLRLMLPVVSDWEQLVPDLLAPLGLPRHPLAIARFGSRALWPARWLAEECFTGERARALFAGLAAHAILPLECLGTAAFGLVLGALGHAVGWPLPRGGSQRIADALASLLRSAGGEIVTSAPIARLDELPTARATLFDIGPKQLLRIAGDRLPRGYRHGLQRYRFGAAAFKLDIALDGEVPWRSPECRHAGTVHVGGTLAEIAGAEAEVGRGGHPDRPFVLVAQQSLFDPSRAPAGRHTLWAYCHVPNGSQVDMSERIIDQIERFAPGLRQRILARHVLAPGDLEAYNPNYVGGDIIGGAASLDQLFTRPVARLRPHTLPVPGFYLCSSSTPPGGGVHGMCGYHAASAALHDLRG